MSAETPENNAPEKAGLKAAIAEIVDPFKSLAQTSRSLWGLYISYVLEGLVYFGVLTILGKYLSENAGLPDTQAGWVYSGLTGGITLAMLFLGGVADKIGVRRALLISLGFMTIGRLALAASGTLFQQGLGAGSPMFFVIAFGLFMVVLGYGMYQPAAYSAVKQFTDEKSSTMGYAMIYGLMNLGAFFSGILSPGIRQNWGIEMVFWVYLGLTILAFLTVLFVMTRRAVEADTVARKKKEEEQSDSPAPAQVPEKRLFTPGFSALALATVACGVALIYTVVSAPVSPAEEALLEIKQRYQAAHKKLKTADEGELDIDELLSTSGREITDQAARIGAPADLSAEIAVHKEVFELVRGLIEAESGYLAGLADQQTDKELKAATEEALATRKAVRVLGIKYLATAYALASPVNEEVLDKLRLRMKKVEEDIIPMSEDDSGRILALTSQPPAEMLRGLATDTQAAMADLRRSLPDAGTQLADMLGPDTVFLGMAARHDLELSSVRGLVSDRLIETSVYLLRGAAPLLEEGSGDEKTYTFAALVAPRLKSAADFSETLVTATNGAIEIPTDVRLKDLATRYGLLALLGLVLLIATIRTFLKRRPDHPFNDGRFVFFIFMLIPVQTLFAHNWLTLPYYIDRAFGGTAVGNNFEFFANINPILIFFLSPLVAALTARAKVYSMMIWGTLVMALPTFLLVLTPNPTLLLTYILLMSIGEAMWQPRFLQWVAEIAPEGKTGIYMGIGQFPWFLTKVLTGMYSGYLLAQYCPMVGPQDTSMLWLIHGIVAMVSPVTLVFARRWMTKGEGV